MLKALLRTTAVFGSLFAAGYVARRYFGWSPEGLLGAAKDRINDMGVEQGSASSSTGKIHQEGASRKAV